MRATPIWPPHSYGQAITRAAEKYRKTDGKLKSSQDSKLRELRALSLTMVSLPQRSAASHPHTHQW